MRTVTIKYNDDGSIELDSDTGLSINIEGAQIEVFYPDGTTSFYSMHPDDIMAEALGLLEVL